MSNESLTCPDGTSPIAIATRDANGEPIDPPPLVDGGYGQVCSLPDGTPMGPLRAFHPTGELEVEGQFEHGLKVGRWTWWDRQGRKRQEGDHIAGDKHGTWVSWRDGQQISERRFDHGKPTGEWREWWPNGKPASLKPHRDGKANGTTTRWHANGQVAETGTLTEGLASGTWVTFDANGQKRSEGSYAADKQVGTWTWWRDDGSVERTATFKDGVELGE